jgi:hypothetical protein
VVEIERLLSAVRRGFRLPTAIGAVLAALPFVAPAHAEVYRCTKNDKVTYSDTPCAGTVQAGKPVQPQTTVPPSTPMATSTAPAPTGFYGAWTGQAQYQATAQGKSMEASHAVVSLILNIAVDGKVTGESKDNGCRALGLASPQTPQTLKLDVSLTGCKYAGYSRRYTGTFGLPPGKGFATISLLAYDTRSGAPSVMYDIAATMRR